MKILVVDDDPVARKVLNTFLTQSNYDVEVVEDAAQALELMQEEDAPPIAIIDWAMPEMNGLELCAKLREMDFPIQPYIFIIHSKKDKNDIAQALDSGADDYLVKPFNMIETCARLRVAERSIARQQQFQFEIERLKAELEEKADGRAADESGDGFSSADDDPVPALSMESLYIDNIVSETLGKIGLMHGAARTPFPAAMPNCGAWNALLIPTEGVWLDLLLEADDLSVAKLFSMARRRQDLGRDELADFCAELHRSIVGGLQSVLSVQNGEVFAPFPACAIEHYEGYTSGQGQSGVTRLHYEVDNATISLLLLPRSSPCLVLPAAQLHPGDIMAEAYPPSPGPEALFKKGMVLNETLLGRLAKYTQVTRSEPLVPIYRPSAMALHYLKHTSAG